MPTLTDQEKEFIGLVVEAGEKALDQDVCALMIEEGIPADDWVMDYRDYTLGEVLDGLEQKGLAYVESEEETIHYNNMRVENGEIQPMKWEDTGVKVIDRKYIYFTERLEEYTRASQTTDDDTVECCPHRACHRSLHMV
jgi:hypothetical protein